MYCIETNEQALCALVSPVTPACLFVFPLKTVSSKTCNCNRDSRFGHLQQNRHHRNLCNGVKNCTVFTEIHDLYLTSRFVDNNTTALQPADLRGSSVCSNRGFVQTDTLPDLHDGESHNNAGLRIPRLFCDWLIWR